MSNRFPWSTLMRLGLHHLRWPPEYFWQSTLRELMISRASAPPDLQQLMKDYPDEQ